MKKIFKRILYLFFADRQWARKLYGGRWVMRRDAEIWVTWNADDERFGEWKMMTAWPMNPAQYICEEWPR